MTRPPTPFWRDRDYLAFLDSLPAKQQLAVRIAHMPDHADDIAFRKWKARMAELWRDVGTKPETVAEVKRLTEAAREAVYATVDSRPPVNAGIYKRKKARPAS